MTGHFPSNRRRSFLVAPCLDALDLFNGWVWTSAWLLLQRCLCVVLHLTFSFRCQASVLSKLDCRTIILQIWFSLCIWSICSLLLFVSWILNSSRRATDGGQVLSRSFRRVWLIANFLKHLMNLCLAVCLAPAPTSRRWCCVSNSMQSIATGLLTLTRGERLLFELIARSFSWCSLREWSWCVV